MEQGNPQKNIGIVISVVVIVGVIVSTIFFNKQSSSTNLTDQSASSSVPLQPTTPSSSVVSTPPPAITNKSSYIYKNGTYSATGSYMSPGGQDQVAVTLTLVNDIVTSVSVTPQAGDRTSQRYINRFLSGYQQYVVGQDISTLSLGRVSGSSLTPIGFNNALSQIRAQAKA